MTFPLNAQQLSILHTQWGALLSATKINPIDLPFTEYLKLAQQSEASNALVEVIEDLIKGLSTDLGQVNHTLDQWRSESGA